MSISLAYWVLMLVWLIFGLWTNGKDLRVSGGNILLFLLLLLLGWSQFGSPIHP
jgi:hypothetical protein